MLFAIALFSTIIISMPESFAQQVRTIHITPIEHLPPVQLPPPTNYVLPKLTMEPAKTITLTDPYTFTPIPTLPYPTSTPVYHNEYQPLIIHDITPQVAQNTINWWLNLGMNYSTSKNIHDEPVLNDKTSSGNLKSVNWSFWAGDLTSLTNKEQK